ncbi:MAG TPA: hypothetical protein DDW52_15285, partial [Planctomycetaceae bacterium]|nr:hypothetical protein [Planctomycetaceae bacterium]
TTSDFGTAGKLQEGTTVAHETAMLKDGRHFLAIVRAGVDPDLVATCGAQERNLVQAAIRTGYKWNTHGLTDRVAAFLSKYEPSQQTLNSAVRDAITSREFEIALLLFEAGAELENPYYYWGTPLHLVLSTSTNGRKGEQDAYELLMKWIENQGVDIAAAQADVDAWWAAKRAAPIGSDGGHEHRMRERAKAEGKDVA